MNPFGFLKKWFLEVPIWVDPGRPMCLPVSLVIQSLKDRTPKNAVIPELFKKKDYVIIRKLFILIENKKLYFRVKFLIDRTLRNQVIKEKKKTFF